MGARRAAVATFPGDTTMATLDQVRAFAKAARRASNARRVNNNSPAGCSVPDGFDVFWCRVGATAIFFETPEGLFTRVFSELKPRTPAPAVRIEFCKFASANSSVRWDQTGLHVRITDVLEGAPAPVLESLAYILISKLVRRPLPKISSRAIPALSQPQGDAPQPPAGEASAWP